ncbi:MAG TPA: hypothetical protein VFU06_12750 [Longimicrobiales bacterium]|nr:hypothetical protein [Longimicrobiales bacterium]
MDQRSARIAGVIAGVLRQAIVDSGADQMVLLADGSPEAGLLASMLEPRLGASFRAREVSGAGWPELLDGWAGVVREQPRALVAAASNKTAALLGGALPGPLLPLGDLWASQVQALCGAWSGPRELQELAGRAGGIDALDAALAMLVDRRRLPEEATAVLPDDAAGTLLALWERGRFARRRLGLVPKLGARTIGVDLFD